jgi:hypothetical protein
MPTAAVLTASTTPATVPSLLNSGPPLLPGLKAASVSISPVYWLFSMVIVRFSPLTPPWVRVIGSPTGNPIAATREPTAGSVWARPNR